MMNKTILITGALKGIGLGIVQAFLENHSNVIITGRDKKLGNEIVDRYKNTIGGELSFFKVDITSENDFKNALKFAHEKYRKIDVLVNNAAINFYKKFIDLEMLDFKQIFDINFFSLFKCSKLFSEYLISHNMGGNIVNIASNAGKIGFPGYSHYNATKSAVINLTQSMSKELYNYDININAVCPGAVETDMLIKCIEDNIKNGLLNKQEIEQSFKPKQINRLIKPIEVGRIVVFLSSDYAKIIRGQAINIDAGETFY